MPIVAGMGGNTGTQALAVSVRRIALGLIAAGSEGRQIVGKEMLVGLVNGLVVGTVRGGSDRHRWATGQPAARAGGVHRHGGESPVAGFAGAFVPLLLERFGIDPAIAASMFVTALHRYVRLRPPPRLASWMLI